MNRQKYIEKILDDLTLLSRRVEVRNSLNLTDLNIHAEDFYKAFINLALGYQLHNINSINPNATAIDLAGKDHENKTIAIQVTSTSNIKKTRTTVDKFIENKLYNKYSKLIILNLVSITTHREKFVGQPLAYELDTKSDIWDVRNLIKLISYKDTVLLKEIVIFLETELKFDSTVNVPKEVSTIVSLIDHFSNSETPNMGNGAIEEPDPDRKINKKFAEHSKYLTNKYVDLYKIYGPCLESIKEETDIGVVQLAKKSLYLQSHSDYILTQCGGDPEVALKRLTQEFAGTLNNKNIDYDETAITFFLVDELIRCNVFPLKRKANA